MVIVDCAVAGAAQRPRNKRARVVKPRRRRVICGLNLEGVSDGARPRSGTLRGYWKDYRLVLLARNDRAPGGVTPSTMYRGCVRMLPSAKVLSPCSPELLNPQHITALACVMP